MLLLPLLCPAEGLGKRSSSKSPGEGYLSNGLCLLQGDLILEGPWRQVLLPIMVLRGYKEPRWGHPFDPCRQVKWDSEVQ